MKHASLCTVLFSVTLTLAAAAQSGTTPAADAHTIRQMMKSAQTPQDYRTLASYFHTQDELFRARAAEEKTEWQRRLAVQSGPTMKYPTGADSARNLYQYYAAKADEMATHAARYDKLAIN